MSKETEKVLLGIDVGSSSSKAVAVSENGEILAAGAASHPTTYPRPGWAEQDAADWAHSTVEAVRQCVGGLSGSKVVAVAVDGPAHNFALIDGDDEVIGPVIHWSDLRSARQAEELAARAGDEIFDVSWHTVNPSWSLAQLAWIRERQPDVWAQARKLLVTKDFVRYRLTGEIATDPYDAWGTQLFDVRESVWSEMLCGLVGLSGSVLPKVLAPHDMAGHITEEAAALTGLSAGTPVFVGSGDTVTEALGIAVHQPGDSVVKLATSGTVLVVTSGPRPDRSLLTYPHVVPESFISMAATNSGAGTMQWFRRAFLTSSDIPDDLVSLTDLAASAPPGADGLMFHPFLMGERAPYWDPGLRAAFSGITASHALAHFVRSVLEGVAFSLRDGLRALEANDAPAENLRLVGGGARSDVWSQILADVFARPVTRVEVPAPAYGTALLAGVGMEWFDWDAVPEPGTTHMTLFEPREDIVDIYESGYGRYRELVPSLRTS